MRSIKLKRSLSSATAAIMALSVLTGTAPGAIGKMIENIGLTASAEEPGIIEYNPTEHASVDINSVTISGINQTYSYGDDIDLSKILLTAEIILDGSKNTVKFTNNSDYEYNIEKDGEDEDELTIKDVGTYRIIFSGINRNDMDETFGLYGTKTITVAVEQKEIKSLNNPMGLTVAEKTFDGTTTAEIDETEYTLTSGDGVVNGETVKIIPADPAGKFTAYFNNIYAGDNKKVIIENCVLDGADSANYKLAEDFKITLRSQKIKKAVMNQTISSAENLTYTRVYDCDKNTWIPQPLINKTDVENGIIYYAVADTKPEKGNDSIWSTEVPTINSAGTYNIWYYVKSNNVNYEDTEINENPLVVAVGKKIIDGSSEIYGSKEYSLFMPENLVRTEITKNKVLPVCFSELDPSIETYEGQRMNRYDYFDVAANEYDITYSKTEDGEYHAIADDTAAKEFFNTAGTYWIQVTGKNNYTGSMKQSFKVKNPKATTTGEAKLRNKIIFSDEKPLNGSACLINDSSTLAAEEGQGTLKWAVTTVNEKPEISEESIWKTDVEEIVGNEEGTYFIWYYVDGAEGYEDSEVKSAGNVKILSASHEFHITYDLDGGEVSEDNVASFTAATADITLINPTKDGYTFAGWTLKGDAVEGVTANSETKATTIDCSEVDRDLEFTAAWTPVEYTITFNNNGANTAVNTPAKYTIENNEIALGTPLKTGYKFKGWYKNADFTGEPVTAIEKGSTGDKTFYAKWAKQVPVTYVILEADKDKLATQNGWEADGNNLKHESAMGTDHSAVQGETLDPLTPPELNTNNAEKFAFGGWYLDENNNGAIDSNESLFDLTKPIDSTAPFTLIAKWNANKVATGSVTAGDANTGDAVAVSKVSADIPATGNLVNESGQTINVPGTDKPIDASLLKVNVANVTGDKAEIKGKLDAAVEALPVASGASGKKYTVTPLRSMNISLTSTQSEVLSSNNPANFDNNISLWVTVKFGSGANLLSYAKTGKEIIAMHISDANGRATILRQSLGNLQIIDDETIRIKPDGFSNFTFATIEETEKAPTTPTTPGSHGTVDYETVTDRGITYHVYSDHAEVAEVDTATETAVIKNKVGGENVTAIAENAFNSCTALKSVTIPATVETIEASAFWGCKALTEITIPETVKTINKDAFKRCTALKTINGVKGSAAEAFVEVYGYTFKDINAVEPATDNKPSAPTNIAVLADGTVTWDKADNAVQYKVFKKYGGTAYYSGWVTDNSYKFKSLPREDYEIYIVAKNEYGTAWSKHLQVKVENPLGTVRKVNVSNGTVSWNAVQGAVSYKVGKVVNGKTYYGSKTTDTSYTFRYVPKSDYKVFVVAFDKDGNKTWGTKVEVKVN